MSMGNESENSLLFKISWFYFKEVTISYLIMYLQLFFFSKLCIYKFYPLGYILIIEAADEKSGAGYAFKDGLQLK